MQLLSVADGWYISYAKPILDAVVGLRLLAIWTIPLLLIATVHKFATMIGAHVVGGPDNGNSTIAERLASGTARATLPRKGES